MTQTPREMLVSALLSIGADGLVNPDGECGCPLVELDPFDGCLDLDGCRPARFVPPDSPGADLDLLQQWPDGYYVAMDEGAGPE